VTPSPSALDSTRGFVAWLKSHPILCLAILTPGIPEYLSTSSPVLSVVTNPVFFPIQLAVNLAQYTAGALLVREAVIRWGKGWGSVLLLGFAYGITEEGLGDNTLFNSTHGTDGLLGWFGRFAGVNWVWATAVLAYHVIYSIGLPILLLGLALPRTRGRSLLGRRGIVVALILVATSTAVEMLFVYELDHFWLGVPLFLGSLLAIALLTFAAYRAGPRFLSPRPGPATLRAWQVGAVGFIFFPIAFLLEYGFIGTRAPPALLIGAELVAFAILFEAIRRGIGRPADDYLLVNLAFGFVVWLAIFGLLLTLGLPYTLPLIAVAIVFFVRLRRAYSPGTVASAPPRGPEIPAGVLVGGAVNPPARAGTSESAIEGV
jgi:hypothetical protein